MRNCGSKWVLVVFEGVALENFRSAKRKGGGRVRKSGDMKKIFSKFEKNEKLENATTKESSNYIGKVFVVGRSTVTVEDILAEGE